MSDHIMAMIEAAGIARRAEVPTGGYVRRVDIFVTEEGFVVRGDQGVVQGLVRKSNILDWPVFDSTPALLPNSVRLVVEELDQARNAA